MSDFKRKIPGAGKYPCNYSPWLMEPIRKSERKNVCLPNLEILEDLTKIESQFKSYYFKESISGTCGSNKKERRCLC